MEDLIDLYGTLSNILGGDFFQKWSTAIAVIYFRKISIIVAW